MYKTSTKLLSLTALFTILIPLTPARADVLDFSAGNWIHGGVTNTGFDSTQTSGYTYLNGTKVTATATQVGTAQWYEGGGDVNMRSIDISGTPGIRMSNVNGGDDQPGSTLQNYQQWTLTFDQAISSFSWDIYDIDAREPVDIDKNWIDVVAAETFASMTVGAVGTGTPVNWLLGDNLVSDNSSFDIEVIYRDTALTQLNTPSDDLNSMATLSNDQSFQTLSLYFFDLDAGSDISHAVFPSAQITLLKAVPEPAVASLLGLAGVITLIVRRGFFT